MIHFILMFTPKLNILNLKNTGEGRPFTVHQLKLISVPNKKGKLPFLTTWITYLLENGYHFRPSLSEFFLNLHKILLYMFFLSLRLNYNQAMLIAFFHLTLYHGHLSRLVSSVFLMTPVYSYKSCTKMQSSSNKHWIISKFLLLQRMYHVNLSLYVYATIFEG